MMNDTNLLEDWYDALALFKWKTAQLNDPYFRNLEKVKNEISAFFPAKDLSGSLQDNHDNWVAHLLFDKQPNSVYIINEIAELLRFYRTLPNRSVLQIISEDGQVNYKAFQEKLFELQVNYLFRTVGLNPEIGHFYEEGVNKKEIDLLLHFDDRTYNIEVTKYYDGFKEEFLRLGTDMLWTIHHTQTKRKITLDEAFSGYIAFKKRSVEAVRSNRHVFGNGLKAFLHGYRSVKDNTIKLPGKKETEQFSFQIEPAFNNNYEVKYEAELSYHPAHIKFQLSADPGTYRSTINLSAQVRESPVEANKRLLEKIREKLNQHKNCPYELIIVIAIEQHFTSFYKNRALPISRDQVDKNAIHELLRGRATLLLIFKTVDNEGIKYERMLLGRGNKDTPLFKKIREIYLPIRYMA